MNVNRKSLNIGCGNSTWGTNRIDITRDSQATELGLATKLPYRDETFDAVGSENVLEHQPNPLEFILECKRVMKPWGILWFVTDNSGYCGWFRLLNKFKDAHGEYFNPRTDKDKHYMIFTMEHIRNLMKEANLNVQMLTLFTRWEPTIIQELLTKISPNIGHSHIFVMVIKK